MKIPLLQPAWHVMLTEECDFYNNPFGEKCEQVILGLNEEEFPEVFIDASFDGKRLRKDPRVVSCEKIWVICPFDFVRPREEIDGIDASEYFSDHLGGTWVGNRFGEARYYKKRSEALTDLAKCDESVEGVCKAVKVRGGVIGPLAKSVLSGDMQALGPPTNAMIEASPPFAEKG
jgi:hypothetical protein